jgi:hypothetical protein
MVLSFLSVSFRPYLKNWRCSGVRLFGTGQDMTALDEQNRIVVIGTKVLFRTQRDTLEHLAWNYETAALPLSYAGIEVKF